tara:strand:- start:5141 stop:5431 length:291 start_codon:yes stop_codon:yes gene_type:complete
MEQINKPLMFLTGLSIVAIIYIVVSSNKVIISSNEVFSKTIIDMMDNKNVAVAPHPYNECIKRLIDQVNKENKQSDFDSMKSVCLGLLDKEKTQVQ